MNFVLIIRFDGGLWTLWWFFESRIVEFLSTFQDPVSYTVFAGQTVQVVGPRCLWQSGRIEATPHHLSHARPSTSDAHPHAPNTLRNHALHENNKRRCAHHSASHDVTNTCWYRPTYWTMQVFTKPENFVADFTNHWTRNQGEKRKIETTVMKLVRE
jgi:hypothetical protein